MAMTVEEKRRSIQTLVESDNEIRAIFVHLDQVMDWPIDSTLQILILVDELKKRMKDDVVHFSFKKKDGTLRHAYGTRLTEIIVRHEGEVLPDSNTRKQASNGSTFPYYDIEKGAWRCFKTESLMDIDRGYTI